MARSKSSQKSEGFCQKIQNAISPFRSRIRRISHQPQASISVTSDKKPPPKKTEDPVRILHQPSLNKMIPVEFEHFSAGKEKTSGRIVQEFGEREILIVRGQKLAKSTSRKTEAAPPDKVEKVSPTEGKPHNHARFAKTRCKKDDESIHEGIFSDYINKVKNRMMKTASNVGGGFEKGLSFK